MPLSQSQVFFINKVSKKCCYRYFFDGITLTEEVAIRYLWSHIARYLCKHFVTRVPRTRMDQCLDFYANFLYDDSTIEEISGIYL